MDYKFQKKKICKIVIVNMNWVFDNCLSTGDQVQKSFSVTRGALLSQLVPKGTEQTERVTI